MIWKVEARIMLSSVKKISSLLVVVLNIFFSNSYADPGELIDISIKDSVKLDQEISRALSKPIVNSGRNFFKLHQATHVNLQKVYTSKYSSGGLLAESSLMAAQAVLDTKRDLYNQALDINKQNNLRIKSIAGLLRVNNFRSAARIAYESGYMQKQSYQSILKVLRHSLWRVSQPDKRKADTRLLIQTGGNNPDLVYSTATLSIFSVPKVPAKVIKRPKTIPKLSVLVPGKSQAAKSKSSNDISENLDGTRQLRNSSSSLSRPSKRSDPIRSVNIRIFWGQYFSKGPTGLRVENFFKNNTQWAHAYSNLCAESELLWQERNVKVFIKHVFFDKQNQESFNRIFYTLGNTQSVYARDRCAFTLPPKENPAHWAQPLKGLLFSDIEINNDGPSAVCSVKKKNPAWCLVNLVNRLKGL